MKVLFTVIFWSTLAFASGADEKPELQSGDIIFQTSSSKQSYAIMWASQSLYSHVGIVEVDGKKQYVLEAISKVSRTPLEKWIARGRLGRYAVYRYDGLSPAKQKQIVDTAKSYLGRGYDIYFSSLNQEIYCSELVDLTFGKLEMPVGKKQKVKELNVDNPVVRRLVKVRWRKHPACKGAKSFDACWKQMLEDTLVTPKSVAEDAKLKKIFSNYP